MAGLGAFGAFVLMAQNGRLRWGVPLGLVCVLVAVWGVMDLVGSFDASDEEAASETTLRRLAPRLAAVLGLSLAFAGSLAFAQTGIGPTWACGALVTATFLAFVVALYRAGETLGPWATDETGAARPLHRRHGFWIVVAASLLYLPALGAGSLWDPWETHYGEVSREILSRDDWISLWWVQEGWFLSKPVLTFWMQSLAMASLGTGYAPGEMLLGAAGHVARPEWVVRAPNVLFAIAGLYLLYKGVAKVFGRRAGALGAVVLMTMPDWLFLAHQTMTDMPFVAAMSAAMGLLLLALHTDRELVARVHRVRVGRLAFGVSAWHLVFGGVLVCALPQLLYLASRNVELVLHGSGPYGFRLHADMFRSGSAGNCGVVPGNEACRTVASTVTGAPPLVQALVGAAAIGLLLYLNRGERRLRPILCVGAWLCAALATLGKGPAGIVLPAGCVLAYVATTRRWKDLLDLAPVSGLLVVLVVALPWYVAMYVRLGAQFTDQLIFQHMINRTVGHIHDTNEGDDTGFVYYVWQLGYAVFPWTGLVPAALLAWLRREDTGDRGRGDASVFLAMWFLIGFALFSFMGTKFHHYIFPAVPPLAMLVGVLLDHVLGAADGAGGEDGTSARRRVHERTMLGGAAIAGACVLGLVAHDLALPAAGSSSPGAIRLLQLFTYNYRRVWPETLDYGRTIALFGGAAVVLGVALAVARIRKYAAIATLVLGGAWAVFCLDVYMTQVSAHWGQRDVIAAYYTSRVNEAEPLVAYQMNWKGEAFYSGNRAATFVSTGTAFTAWMKQQREKGVKVMYFVTEHNRTGGLRAEVGARAYREITDRALCNKFVLVRAEL